jgi:hypothetical protein
MYVDIRKKISFLIIINIIGGGGDCSIIISNTSSSRLTTEPCALGSTQPLKMSTRILLGVKPAGA